jgi:hypothetical protein
MDCHGWPSYLPVKLVLAGSLKITILSSDLPWPYAAVRMRTQVSDALREKCCSRFSEIVSLCHPPCYCGEDTTKALSPTMVLRLR